MNINQNIGSLIILVPIKRIGVGKYQILLNDDDAAHTMTSGTTETGPDGVFDSCIILTGSTHTFSMPNKVEHDWYCAIHPRITGKVIVG